MRKHFQYFCVRIGAIWSQPTLCQETRVRTLGDISLYDKIRSGDTYSKIKSIRYYLAYTDITTNVEMRIEWDTRCYINDRNSSVGTFTALRPTTGPKKCTKNCTQKENSTRMKVRVYRTWNKTFLEYIVQFLSKSGTDFSLGRAAIW